MDQDDVDLTASLELERERGASAERLMNEPLLMDAFAAVEQAILSEWRTCPNPERRDRLWVEQLLLNQVKGHLQTVMQTGKLAVHQLGEIKERRRLMNWLSR